MAKIVGVVSVIADANNTGLSGVTDLEIVPVDGAPMLYIGSEIAGSVTAYSIANPAAPVAAGTVGFSAASGTDQLTDIEAYSVGGAVHLVTLGRYDDNFGRYTLAGSTAPSFAAAMGDSTAPWLRGHVVEIVTREGATFAYTASFGSPGFDLFRIGADGGFTHVQTYEDVGNSRLGDVTALTGATLHGTEYLFTGSGFDTGIQNHFVTRQGRLIRVDLQAPGQNDGPGLRGISEMVATQIDDRAFLVAGGALTDNLVVYRVSQAGKMVPVDNLWDTRDTRFEGVTALELIETGTRTFLVAGGADDGITLLELTWNGRLVVHDTLADEFDTTLNNISDIEATGAGDTWTLAVSSLNEPGVTLIALDLSQNGGQEVFGGPVRDTITGTGGDDILWGRGKSDTLAGGAGDDRLIDGRGRDVMEGGPGADTFVFIEDGRTDWIADFEVGIDTIDLTDFDRVYDISALTILPRKAGAVIFVDQDIIRVTNPDGGPFDVSLFTAESFVFG